MSSVGQPIPRIDGRIKVTGQARFAAEHALRGVVHAVPVLSVVARGRIRNFDLRAARQVEGVIAILTHENTPRLPYKPQPDDTNQAPPGQFLRPLYDDRVQFDRQYVALVVADTLDRAEEAARLVRVRYQAEPAVTDFVAAAASVRWPKPSPRSGDPDVAYQRGDPVAAYGGAEVRVDATYAIPVEHHNPIEPFATTAVWRGRQLTVYDKTQWPGSVQGHLASAFDIPVERVRVVCPFVGGAFGAANRPWPNVLLAAIAAKAVGRPVRLSLSREAMYGTTGFRPQSQQRIRLGADRSGKLVSVIHDATSQTSTYEQHADSPLAPTEVLYRCPNVRTAFRLIRMNVSTPTYMRGPGFATGAYALESAMDELSYRLGLDPVELRLRNYAATDDMARLPYSEKSLRQCYDEGAQRFGWARRNPVPGSMRAGRLLIGQGMASAVYDADRQDASAGVSLRIDGSVVVRTSSSDMGPGTYTSLAQIAADAVGVAITSVHVQLGDTNFPPGPMQAGSTLLDSLGPVVLAAADAVRQDAVAAAVNDRSSPLYRADPARVRAEGGRLFLIAEPSRGETYAGLVSRLGRSLDRVKTISPDDHARFAFYSFGAHFVEVSVDPDVFEVRVRRVVSAVDVGRIVNPRIADSQARGAIIGGLGMALLEHTRFDPGTGRIMNANLADYLTPVNADVPRMEPIFVQRPDRHRDALGVRGVGEIPLVGLAAAVANAVFHATGKRIRDLPITVDKLI